MILLTRNSKNQFLFQRRPRHPHPPPAANGVRVNNPRMVDFGLQIPRGAAVFRGVGPRRVEPTRREVAQRGRVEETRRWVATLEDHVVSELKIEVLTHNFL
jgi:hypothetical protein